MGSDQSAKIKKVLFIVNPKSAIGQKRNVDQKIISGLDPAKFLAKVVYTKRPGHATELAKQALEEGTEIIIAVGGDGTINEIGQVIAGTDAVLGIIPAGSGNGLARHLKIPVWSMKRAIAVINRF